jgi:hypothetical protein
MFFYLYMITVFLEMLLVTGIIPTASTVYPVSLFEDVGSIIILSLICRTSLPVVHSSTCWFNKCYFLVLIVERICWFPIC